MVYDGGTIKLEHLIQKSIRYEHHYLNYKASLEKGLIPNGLKISNKTSDRRLFNEMDQDIRKC